MRLYLEAYPLYDCADCIGMRDWGCWCNTQGCVAPCAEPTWWHRFLRHLLT